MGAEVWLDRWGVRVPRRVDADRNVCLQTEACLADVWVPQVELGDCEVVERLGNAQAGVGWLDSVESRTIGWTDGTDLMK